MYDPINTDERPGRLARFFGVFATILNPAAESLADESNQADARAWFVDVFRRARETPAEQLAEGLIRAAGMGIVIAKDVFASSLPAARTEK